MLVVPGQKAFPTSLTQKSTIQKFITGFLLVVFTVSIAPKDLFHHAFAGHNDWEGFCSDDLKSPHLHQSGTDCDFDDLVVTALYHFSIDSFSAVSFQHYQERHPHLEASCLLQTFPLKENRGPPAI